MRKLLVKIVQILDGTPAIYGKRQSGQSVVELALITPLLIILLAGLVEIGWFANNYLTLLDVTRAGARRGAVLQDQQSPLSWDDTYSYVPNAMLTASYQLDPSANYQMPNSSVADVAANGDDVKRFHYRWTPDTTTFSGSLGPSACDVRYVPDRTFYSEIICTMITSMDPLVMNPSNGIDDIIVSGFALQMIDPANAAHAIPEYNAAAGPQMVVVGRYPTNANECDVAKATGTGLPSDLPNGRELRNPFDINANGKRDIALPGTATGPYEVANPYFTELPGFEDRPQFTDVSHAEKQVGFSLFGNHKIPGTYCVGSEWTMNQIETLMNIPDYGLLTAQDKDVLPNQGVVLVELYWEHEMLLKIPVLSPVYTAVGNQNGKMVINVWAAFPLGSVEPHIDMP